MFSPDYEKRIRKSFPNSPIARNLMAEFDSPVQTAASDRFIPCR